MIKNLRFLLGDQLHLSLSSLQDIDPLHDVILMAEVKEETVYVPHHPKKIALLFSAMRHFAETLRQHHYQVRYVSITDPANCGSLMGELQRAVEELSPQQVIMAEPGEWRLYEQLLSWQNTPGNISLTLRPDTRFLCTRSAFQEWAGHKKSLRMEYFYRHLRKEYGILLDHAQRPLGGQWNFDKENRQPPRSKMTFPARLHFAPDHLTKEVLDYVETHFSHHFGNLYPFDFAVTQSEAEQALEHFLTHFLPFFGTYQDAMIDGEPFLYHSHLSAYLNCGLLLPLEVIQKAEAAYHQGHVPLPAVEGFIRQIMGWREFIRGIYWLRMPIYAEQNYFGASRPLPEFYWTGNTEMQCMKEAISHTKQHAYSHHIQRLMVTGNFALLAGIAPKEICDWYLAVYADAYEWVELPNTLGMALYGDGGFFASKPYAASGKYIHRMSNFCQSCCYDPDILIGDKACPFNSLYWYFLESHQSLLRDNQRMQLIYTILDRFTLEKKRHIRQQAEAFLASL